MANNETQTKGETMTDAKAKQIIRNANPRYTDDHITTDPHQWRTEITISRGYCEASFTFTGEGETKGESRKHARQMAAAKIVDFERSMNTYWI